MPSCHQRRTFQAMLLAFLTPQRSALPEHNTLRSNSSISRFLNPLCLAYEATGTTHSQDDAQVVA